MGRNFLLWQFSFNQSNDLTSILPSSWRGPYHQIKAILWRSLSMNAYYYLYHFLRFFIFAIAWAERSFIMESYWILTNLPNLKLAKKLIALESIGKKRNWTSNVKSGEWWVYLHKYKAKIVDFVCFSIDFLS